MMDNRSANPTREMMPSRNEFTYIEEWRPMPDIFDRGRDSLYLQVSMVDVCWHGNEGLAKRRMSVATN